MTSTMRKPEEKIMQLPQLQEPSPLFVDGLIGWFHAGEKGRGMVALKDIPAGTVMERDPVIVMPNVPITMPNGEEPILEHYMFRWGPEGEDKETKECVWALGNIPLINHKDEPNSDLRQDYENGVMELFALQDIKRGEEITIDYDADLWFDVAP